MTKNMKDIIEEQRRYAADLHDWNPEVAEIHPLAYLVVEYFDEDVERFEKFAKIKAETLPELAAAARMFVEREIVESTWVSRGDLTFGFAFYALHDVDWIEVATHLGKKLKQRERAIAAAKKTGLWTLIQAEDDLPKN